MLGAPSIYSAYGRNERWLGDYPLVYVQHNGQHQGHELAFMLLPSCFLDLYSSPGGGSLFKQQKCSWVRWP